MVSKLNQKQLAELKNCFTDFDRDGSGSISAQELGGVCEALGLSVSGSDLEQLMGMMDTDGSGTINFDEFAAVMAESFFKTPTENELSSAFDLFDKDGSGYISEDELLQVMGKFRGGVTIAEIKNMIKSCDKDSDGKINKKEFIQIVMSV